MWSTIHCLFIICVTISWKKETFFAFFTIVTFSAKFVTSMIIKACMHLNWNIQFQRDILNCITSGQVSVINSTMSKDMSPWTSICSFSVGPWNRSKNCEKSNSLEEVHVAKKMHLNNRGPSSELLPKLLWSIAKLNTWNDISTNAYNQNHCGTYVRARRESIV